MSGNPPGAVNAGPEKDAEDANIASLIDLMMRGAQAKLDDIEEPTPADLAALEDLDDLPEIETPPPTAIDLRSLLSEPEEPEMVSLETLDDADEAQASPEDLDEVEELLEDVETLIEDYIDVELDDDELEDEGYDLDDEDINSYHDLYGDDDTIIPSFREGEFAEEEDGDTDYYNELR
ncbi:MAG: hypothetical protein OXG53_20110 [Chloroflexi bacterium]|nr:hypothetical protein [Chloroflexota bacterium]